MPMLSNLRSRFLGGGRLAVPVPVLGAELLTDGGLENWNSATDLTSWAEVKAGTSTVNQDADAYAGSYACRFDVDSSNSSAAIQQAGVLTSGAWYLVSLAAKASAGGKTIASDSFALSVTPTTSYAAYLHTGRASATFANIKRGSAASASLYIDAISCKAITLASMFSTRLYGTHVTVKANCTIVAGTRAGVVCNLDSASSPQNFVIASVDSAGTARLTKCVAGTYTELISTAVTYVAGAFVEIRRLAGTTTYRLFYAGSQVGTDQTIADSQIVSNVLCGMFNTFSGNSLTGFSCVPSA